MPSFNCDLESCKTALRKYDWSLKVAYEIAKGLAGEFQILADRWHYARGHAGHLRDCASPECAHRRERMALWTDVERSIEDPSFHAVFDSRSGRFEEP